MSKVNRGRVARVYAAFKAARDSDGIASLKQSEIASQLQLHNSVVSYAVAELKHAGLIEKTPVGWRVFDEPQPPKAALPQNTQQAQTQLLQRVVELLEQQPEAVAAALQAAVGNVGAALHETKMPRMQKSSAAMPQNISAVASNSVPAMAQEPQPAENTGSIRGVPAEFPQPQQAQDIPRELWPWPESENVREFFACDQDGAIWALSLGKEVPAGIWVPVMEGFRPADMSYAKGGLYYDADGRIVGQQIVYQDACRLWGQNQQGFMNFVCHIKKRVRL